MKSYIYLFVLFLVLIVSSCSVSNKSITSCPDFKQKRQAVVKSIKKGKTASLLARKQSKERTPRKTSLAARADLLPTNVGIKSNGKLSLRKAIKAIRKIEKQSSMTANALDSQEGTYALGTKGEVGINLTNLFGMGNDECDTIVDMDGVEIDCIVKEITPDEIKYVKCGKEDGPVFSVNKENIVMIHYADGTYESIISENVSTNEDPIYEEDQETNGFAVAGMILGILSFVLLLVPLLAVLSLPAAIVGLILSLVGLKKVNADPERWKGKGMAIAGIVCSALLLAIFIIAIFVILSLL